MQSLVEDSGYTIKECAGIYTCVNADAISIEIKAIKSLKN